MKTPKQIQEVVDLVSKYKGYEIKGHKCHQLCEDITSLVDSVRVELLEEIVDEYGDFSNSCGCCETKDLQQALKIYKKKITPTK